MTSPSSFKRLFLLDDARTCSTLEVLQEQIVFLAKAGIDGIIWHFSDDQGCRIRFNCCPEIGVSPAFSTDEVRKLICFAKQHGVSLIPELAALGHSRYITRLPQYEHLNEHEGPYSGMCPVHPQTRQIVRALLQETIELFDSPVVHVGMDEVDIGQHPLTDAALQSKTVADLISDHLTFLRQIVVEEAGREMWIWGDGLLANRELMEKTSKDIVVCNWQYRPTAVAETTQQLLDAGFEVIAASGLLTHDQTLFPSNEYALKNVLVMAAHESLKGEKTGRGVRGHIVTTWIPCRSISQSQWLGWHLAIDRQNGGGLTTQDAAVRAFGRDFHGLLATDDWAAAVRILLSRSPNRAEWMAVNKLNTEALAAFAEGLPEAATDFQLAADGLRAIRPEVREHLEAFDALQLLLDLLAHCYSAAAAIAAGDVDADVLRTLHADRLMLLSALSAAWDREHFADDPAKTQAVIHYFRDDHLLLTVRDGLLELESRLAATRPGQSVRMARATQQSVA